MLYPKQAISIAEQLVLLKDRGLLIEDEAYAERVLLNVGYYRLSGYWRPLQVETKTHAFQEGAKFSKVVKLYQFDREFRLLCAHMLERIEVAVRTKLKYYPSHEFDPWWFEDQSLFANRSLFRKNLEHISREIDRSKEDFIAHHRRNYSGDNRLPPAWKTLEVISFGTLSKLYKALTEGDARKQIAKDLGLPNKSYLESWMQVFTIIRNVCAHHSRLWNRMLRQPPKVFKIGSNQEWLSIESHEPRRMYISICCMVYALRYITADRSMEQQLVQLFEKYPEVRPTAIGFPIDWRDDRFWHSPVLPLNS